MKELNYINENKDYISESITESADNTDDEIEVKTLEKIYKLWKMKDNLTDKELEKNVSELMEYIEQFLEIEFSDEAMEQFDDDFKEFIQKIYLLSIDIKQAEKRLYSYFDIGNRKSKPTNEKKQKTYKQIIENINNNKRDWEIPNNLIGYFWQGARNTILEQSELNRARSLYKNGASLEEALKTVVVNKDKQIKLEKLIRKHQSRAVSLDEQQKRLY
jgi:hypothetical protein